jgi:hypothetical protein
VSDNRGDPRSPCDYPAGWTEIRLSSVRHDDALIVTRPDALEETGPVRTALVKMRQLIRSTPRVNADGPKWKLPVEKAEAEK